MSFKWKWLLTTFVAQLMLGGIFTGIQYTHMANVAETELQRTRESFQAELTQAHRSGSTYSMNAVSSMVRDFYTRYKPTAVWIDSGDGVLYTLGEVPKSTEQLPPPLLSTIALPTLGHQLIILFDQHEVYRSRDEMVFYLVGVFLLSAIACSMILYGLGNTLSARLEDLRSKAMELQSGNIQSRIEVRGRDEISCLGAAFNSMAQAIEQQMKVMEENHANSVSEKNRLDMLLSSLGSGVAYLDENFKVLYLNRALAKMLKLTIQPAKPVRLEQVLLMAGVVKEQRMLLKDMVTDYFGNHEMPIELNFNDGRVLQFRFAVYNDKSQGAHAVLIVEDVSIRKNVEDLRNEVERDPLTGVLNRRGFDITLQARLSRLLPGETLGMMFLDLDGFKAVNDTLGHKAGDQILKTSATLLKGATRNVDYVARLGGDEFAIIVARCNIQLLKNISERIIESFACDKLLVRIRQNHGLTVSCSIGAAMHPLHGTSIQALLEISDEQMYQAKKSGKNCYRIAGVTEPQVKSVSV
ncbi:MAG: diguanylate cyclase [Gammaproteobacteria bacterium]|uniref:GGDEF domain-containing protein n=1 Tax=Limnobacter sp. TaxID=2003368 RepID=UPI001D5CFD90|nr:diguanylate cyclase [Limnobacter sp.]MBU0784662.1 diguanylate cyclase [Gammaproteobacteria bacterium]MBU0848047.1 diguanylate cyclase [Gammaproteobacteria bacterium]MBU1266338.1 diguanylate cyclase [Gammaproteobacteria bacterium]MBU1529947.1 diguanylate cyclase [Gammaproteobacteria bacterium]MBU1779916.1 diguanylate cyclase [Gammaproteobacteria bacterium]